MYRLRNTIVAQEIRKIQLRQYGYPHPHLIDNCIYVHYIKQTENFLISSRVKESVSPSCPPSMILLTFLLHFKSPTVRQSRPSPKHRGSST